MGSLGANRPLWVAISGGVGGAKLALGLSRVLAPEELLIVANTGDDFHHSGLPICPDIDTLIYTLAGVANPETGWGLRDETWEFMAQLKARSPEDAWFQIGDKDLKTHRRRARWLSEGQTLSKITRALCRDFGVAESIVPMSDSPVRTQLFAELENGWAWMDFQEYFVKRRCEPRVSEIRYWGSEKAEVQPDLRRVFGGGRVRGVLICPSNPFLSVAPVLSVPGLNALIRNANVPVVAVSPIVGGKALKGPTDKLMGDLGMSVDVCSIARFYGDLLHGLVIDQGDEAWADGLGKMGVRVTVTNTIMRSLEDRENLAKDVLHLGKELTG